MISAAVAAVALGPLRGGGRRGPPRGGALGLGGPRGGAGGPLATIDEPAAKPTPVTMLALGSFD